MSSIAPCPQCQSTYVYADGSLWVCPECAHEWGMAPASESTPEESGLVVRDASGNLLSEGDNVTVIKDLPVKGASQSIKVGTKVKGIHLVESHNGHNISCKIDGFGAMMLKSEFVRKA